MTLDEAESYLESKKKVIDPNVVVVLLQIIAEIRMLKSEQGMAKKEIVGGEAVAQPESDGGAGD